MADENAPNPQAPSAAPTAPSGQTSGPEPRDASGGHSGPPGHGGPSRFGGPGGPRPQGGGRPGGPAKRGKRSFIRKKKVCRFCVDKSDYIDYKKSEILAPVPAGTRKDFAAPHDGNLRAAPALASCGDQAGAKYRAAAIRSRTVTFGPFFCCHSERSVPRFCFCAKRRDTQSRNLSSASA